MTKDVQHIRRSQFVHTYGPGSIIESRNGPRLIPAIDKGLSGFYFSREKLEMFEITDSRLSVALKNITGKPTRIFALPSNLSLGKSEQTGIYRTQIFPTWRICYGRKKNHMPVLYNSYDSRTGRERFCPVCGKSDESSAVRFVAACIDGHLDEVPWNYAVHHGSGKGCDTDYFLWDAGGSSLSDIKIKCPKCGATTDMGNIYRLHFKCTGRQPEREEPKSKSGPFYTEPKRPERCDKKMKVVQRQSTSLHISQTLTLLTIPEFDTNISGILQRPEISAAIASILTSPYNNPCSGGMKMEDLLAWIRSHPQIPDVPFAAIEKYILEYGIRNFCNLFSKLHDSDRSFMDFIYEEFESLLGAPDMPPTPNFSMAPGESFKVDILPKLDIHPITKIRTITAQIGYYRVPYTDSAGGDEPEYISSAVQTRDHDGWWYPGFEGIGEGVFITFSDREFSEISESRAYGEWSGIFFPTPRIGDKDSEGAEVQGTPLFVWLHTLSHSIIKVLSLYSGYSSSSLHERVYVDRTAKNGGILIYTTSPGEDGSMGGLVEVVEKFDEILKRALENLRICSNDPLCSDVRQTGEKLNGAACHSCLLISETSCAYRNRWLDRHIVLGD